MKKKPPARSFTLAVTVEVRKTMATTLEKINIRIVPVPAGSVVVSPVWTVSDPLVTLTPATDGQSAVAIADAAVTATVTCTAPIGTETTDVVFTVPVVDATSFTLSQDAPAPR